MKLKSKSITWTVALAAALSLGTARPCAADIAATALTLPSGYLTGTAIAVNASGQVAGQVASSSPVNPGYPDFACVWTDGTPTVLPNLAGDAGGTPKAINAGGVVVGYCLVPGAGIPYAVRWAPDAEGNYTTVEYLGMLDGQENSTATAINEQGQILCASGSSSDVRWFLWEDGAKTEITTSDGTPIDAYAYGPGLFFGDIGLLASNGRGAGTVDLGTQDADGYENHQAVFWQKTDTGISVTPLTAGGAEDHVEAISPNGVVAGYSTAGGFFIYDSNTGTITYPDVTPPDNESVNYLPVAVFSVNDHGDAVIEVEADIISLGDMHTVQPWVWQAGGLTQIPLDSLLDPGNVVYIGFGAINNNGQVAGGAAIADFSSEESSQLAFGWSASMGIQELGGLTDRPEPTAVALNDSGLVVGLTGTADFSSEVPVTWNLPGSAYSWSGVLNPLNADGSSVFHAGSTVPVKFMLTGADAGTTDLVATLSYALISEGTAGEVNEADTKVGASSGNQFRYDAASGQYVFNWSTKDLSPGTYRLFIDLGDGAEHSVDVGLK